MLININQSPLYFSCLAYKHKVDLEDHKSSSHPIFVRNLLIQAQFLVHFRDQIKITLINSRLSIHYFKLHLFCRWKYIT